VDRKKHIKMLLQFGIRYDLMVEQKKIVNGTQYSRDKIYSSQCCKAVWLRKLLAGLFDLELEPTLIYCDNQSCVKLSENPDFHDKSKHIEIKYHFI
jgi:hypothetical protein